MGNLGLDNGAEARALAEALAVPYITQLESVHVDGEWVRRASYPELPGPVGVAVDAFDAVELLDLARVEHFTGRVRDGSVLAAAPRPPLAHSFRFTEGM